LLITGQLNTGSPKEMLNVMEPEVPLTPSTSIKYVVPAVTAMQRRLVSFPPPSSLYATDVKLETDVPVKTRSIVSKPLPIVEITTIPEDGAVHAHQTDFELYA
jgi:hypothetical protein